MGETMLGASSTDILSCPRCGTRPQRLTLARFRRDVGERSYRAFLAHHLRAFSRDEIAGARRGARAGLPPSLEAEAEALHGEYREALEPESLGRLSTREVLERVAAQAGEAAWRAEEASGDAEILDLFEHLTLSLVLDLHERQEVRQRVLAAERGWMSANWKYLALAAVGAATVLVSGDPTVELLGWGVMAAGLLPPLARAFRR